jgi:acetyltransferase
MIIPDLNPLFDPDSVAVVGASPDATYASRLVDNLLQYGYEGDFYPVNPNRTEAWGRHCYDDIEELPTVPDLVVVSIPREYVVDVVDKAGELGVPAALVISAGFGEADETGIELETELGTVAAEREIRICGPNCIGVADAQAGTVLTSTCTRRPEPGGIGLVSQSGALAFTTFYERGTDESTRFAAIASTGNEVDLSLADYVDYMADRSDVEVICAYVEGLDDPDRFMAAAERATRNGTPVLAVKVGRSDIAEAATLSHTGSLTGSDDAWAAAFDQSGVERVPDIPDLLGRASAHAAFDPPESGRVCIASTSGGLASLLADLANERGLDLPPLPADTEAELLNIEELLTFGELHNPADIRGYGAEALPEIAEALFAADTYDAYVFAIGLSAVDERAARVAEDLMAIADAAPTPVAFLWTGRKEPTEDSSDPLPYERLQSKWPLFYDPARCLDAVASLVDAGETRRRLSLGPTRTELRDRLDASKLPDLPREQVLTWGEATDLLSSVGINTVETRLVTDAETAAAAADAVGFPVAMKIDSRDVAHRSDIGAVRAKVRDQDEARRTYEEIVENTRDAHPGAAIKGVLVQQHIDDGVEALVGVSSDDVFDSLVTVAPGGTLVETLDDGAVRVPPLSEANVEVMIDETALAGLLEGTRGTSAVDRAALVDLVQRIGDLAAEAPLAELDLNPVLVRENDVVVVDALVRTTE